MSGICGVISNVNPSQDPRIQHYYRIPTVPLPLEWNWNEQWVKKKWTGEAKDIRVLQDIDLIRKLNTICGARLSFECKSINECRGQTVQAIVPGKNLNLRQATLILILVDGKKNGNQKCAFLKIQGSLQFYMVSVTFDRSFCNKSGTFIHGIVDLNTGSFFITDIGVLAGMDIRSQDFQLRQGFVLGLYKNTSKKKDNLELKTNNFALEKSKHLKFQTLSWTNIRTCQRNANVVVAEVSFPWDSTRMFIYTGGKSK